MLYNALRGIMHFFLNLQIFYFFLGLRPNLFISLFVDSFNNFNNCCFIIINYFYFLLFLYFTILMLSYFFAVCKFTYLIESFSFFFELASASRFVFKSAW